MSGRAPCIASILKVVLRIGADCLKGTMEALNVLSNLQYALYYPE